MPTRDEIELPTETPFFEKDKGTQPPLVPCKPWLDCFIGQLSELKQAIANIAELFILVANAGGSLATQEAFEGTVSTAANAVIGTVDVAQLQYAERIVIVISNNGSSERLVIVKRNGVAVFTGNTTNSPLLPGKQLNLDLALRLEAGQSVTASVDGGTDVTFNGTFHGKAPE